MPRAVSYHGDTREDEYAWLRDDNWQAVMKNPDALAGDIRAQSDWMEFSSGLKKARVVSGLLDRDVHI